jgi:hypothetical protein
MSIERHNARYNCECDGCGRRIRMEARTPTEATARLNTRGGVVSGT